MGYLVNYEMNVDALIYSRKAYYRSLEPSLPHEWSDGDQCCPSDKNLMTDSHDNMSAVEPNLTVPTCLLLNC